MSRTVTLLVCMALCSGALCAGDADHTLTPEATQADKELTAVVTAVMTQAEALGMPPMTGATLFYGPLTAFKVPNDEGYEIVDVMHIVQARLADGSWLVDLWDHVPAKVVDRTEIAALKPVSLADFAHPDMVDPVGNFTWQQGCLRLARLVQAGARAAPQALITQMHALSRGIDRYESPACVYPRVPVGRTPEEFVRLACRWWFLDRLRAEPLNAHWGDAAIAIAPLGWRSGTVTCVARFPAALALTKEFPDQAPDADRVAHGLAQDDNGGVLPSIAAISDDRLIALTSSTQTARLAETEAGTVGDCALGILGERWGIDPALCAGCDLSAPWDDAERDTLSRALKAWWTATAGKSLVDRLASAVPRMPLAAVHAALEWRTNQRALRRWRSSLNAGNQPEGAAAPAPDDVDAVTHAFGDALVARLTPPPADADLGDLQMLMVDLKTVPAFSACVESWPRMGRLRPLMAAWDDAHGKPAGVNTLVAEWLAHPLTDEPLLTEANRLGGYELETARIHAAISTPLLWWVTHGTSERWTRLQTLCGGDLTQASTARLLAACGMQWIAPDMTADQSVNLSVALVYTALNDHRPLSAELIARAERIDQKRMRNLPSFYLGDAPTPALQIAAPAADLRVCDLALIQSLAFGVNFHEVERNDHSLSTACLASPVADRDRVIAIFVAAYRQEAEASMHGPSVHVVAGHRDPAPPAVEKTAAGLTPEESSVCHQIVNQAQSLGFPDLTGAQVVNQRLDIVGGGTWWGLHLHLQDGTWLANGVVAYPADRATSQGHILTPPTAVEVNALPAVFHRLPAHAQTRFKDNAIIASLHNDAEGGVLGALVWWLSGRDANGGSVVAACLQAAAEEHFTADVFRGATGRGADTLRGTIGEPEIPAILRQALARWFCDQLVLAPSPSDGDRWAQAARTILAAQDRPSWDDMITRLRARLVIPKAAPPGADLASRLASWRDLGRDPVTGNWAWAGPPPASIDDTPALVALLGDPRPSRWIESAWVPLTVGDTALDALGELWHVDWRWLVVDDPQVAACLAPLDASAGKHAMEWHLVQSLWTDRTRAAVATALKAWWAQEGAHVPIRTFIQHAPVEAWSDVLLSQPSEHLDNALADDIVVQWSRHSPGQTQERLFIMMALRYPSHAGITALLSSAPDQPWLRQLLSYRSGLAGDAAALDRSFQEVFSGDLPPPSQRSGQPQVAGSLASPWLNLGLVTHASTPERLASWRTALARDLEDRTTLGLVAQLGRRFYPIAGDTQQLHELIFPHDGERSALLPAQLAMMGLADHRPIATISLPILTEYSRRNSWYRMSDLAQCRGIRVCDIVAVHLLQHADEFPGEWRPHDVRDADDLLGATPEQRDGDITKIAAALATLVHHLDAPPPVVGVSDF